MEDAPGSTFELRRFGSAAVVVAADGQVHARYDKVLRVPFGEYVPWRTVIDRAADLSLIPRDAIPARTAARESALEASELVRAGVTSRTGRTPYVAAGDGPMLAVAVILVVLGWRRDRSGRRIFT